MQIIDNRIQIRDRLEAVPLKALRLKSLQEMPEEYWHAEIQPPRPPIT
ncbi:hypothetical protein [Achromobacter denitrificans]